MSFARAISHVLEWEGGYVNDPDDPGGETNFGISKRAYPDLNIRELSRDGAIDIYRRDYWKKYRLDDVQDEEIAEYIFDMVVNHGGSNAIKMVQRTVNAFIKSDIEVDGGMGPLTLAAINSVNPERLLLGLIGERARFYLNLATRKEAMSKFLGGWLNRAFAPVVG